MAWLLGLMDPVSMDLMDHTMAMDAHIGAEAMPKSTTARLAAIAGTTTMRSLILVSTDVVPIVSITRVAGKA
jgi:hypothetical protein